MFPLTLDFLIKSLTEVSKFAGLVLGATVVLELYLYVHFKYNNRRNIVAVFWISVPALASLAYFLFRAARAESMQIPADAYRTLWKVLLTALLLEIALFLLFRYLFTGKHGLSLLLIAPAFIGMGVLIVFPFLFQIYLAFTRLNLYAIKEWMATGRLQFVGIENFISIFTTSILFRTPTWWLFIRTILWTAINVFFQVTIGMGLALLLNRKMWLKGVYRTILVFPWVIPQFIAISAWRAEFSPAFGFVNIVAARIGQLHPFLQNLGIADIPWRADPFWTFAMVCIVNIWLGVPFNMVAILGGLQSISPEFYDAADIDGAGALQTFRYVTVPLLRPVLTPVILLGTIWTFNAINVVYLMTGIGSAGVGAEHADIVISAAYKAAFQYDRYSSAAAVVLLVFVVLLLFTVLWVRLTKGAERVY